MKLLNIIIFSGFGIFFSVLTSAAFAQKNMEQLLNNIDAPSSWSNTPVSAPSTVPANGFGSNSGNAASGMSAPGYTQESAAPSMRQQVLQTLFGQSTTSNLTGDGKKDWGSSNAYSDWQEAENQASRAHDAEERARYDKDKWRRGDDASAAYYAANSARNASDKVYHTSLNGDPTARQYVDKAKAAADRAQADSDQARYFADSND